MRPRRRLNYPASRCAKLAGEPAPAGRPIDTKARFHFILPASRPKNIVPCAACQPNKQIVCPLEPQLGQIRPTGKGFARFLLPICVQRAGPAGGMPPGRLSCKVIVHLRATSERRAAGHDRRREPPATCCLLFGSALSAREPRHSITRSSSVPPEKREAWPAESWRRRRSAIRAGGCPINRAPLSCRRPRLPAGRRLPNRSSANYVSAPSPLAGPAWPIRSGARFRRAAARSVRPPLASLRPELPAANQLGARARHWWRAGARRAAVRQFGARLWNGCPVQEAADGADALRFRAGQTNWPFSILANGSPTIRRPARARNWRPAKPNETERRQARLGPNRAIGSRQRAGQR